jgi:hypothetical protein
MVEHREQTHEASSATAESAIAPATFGMKPKSRSSARRLSRAASARALAATGD